MQSPFGANDFRLLASDLPLIYFPPATKYASVHAMVSHDADVNESNWNQRIGYTSRVVRDIANGSILSLAVPDYRRDGWPEP